jgi:hypothetical protein
VELVELAEQTASAACTDAACHAAASVRLRLAHSPCPPPPPPRLCPAQRRQLQTAALHGAAAGPARHSTSPRPALLPAPPPPPAAVLREGGLPVPHLPPVLLVRLPDHVAQVAHLPLAGPHRLQEGQVRSCSTSPSLTLTLPPPCCTDGPLALALPPAAPSSWCWGALPTVAEPGALPRRRPWPVGWQLARHTGGTEQVPAGPPQLPPARRCLAGSTPGAPAELPPPLKPQAAGGRAAAAPLPSARPPIPPIPPGRPCRLWGILTFGTATPKPSPEPNNMNDVENCAGGNFSMSFGSPKVAGWADNVCEDPHIYMCKIQCGWPGAGARGRGACEAACALAAAQAPPRLHWHAHRLALPGASPTDDAGPDSLGGPASQRGRAPV